MILDPMEVIREQLIEQGGALKRMSAKLIEMMAETTTYNDLQVTILVNTLEERQVEGQCIEQEGESQPLHHSLLADVDVEEVDKSEDVKHNASSELGCIGPHSKHFSTLHIGGNLEIEASKHMDRGVDEEQCPYILKYIIPKTHNDIPHLRAKKRKMQHLLLGPFTFTPPPLEHNKILENKLGVKLISSKWKEKW
ncbi:hypothetical protein HAX54_046147 [Datura stramonium]|uniref:Uncharacterized protein n=1 Tax=Datura stramonium TaxID=4076 RepID=A0ABS8WJ32_DATST|nr:hypothetical protein [Datura stramonium]